jgi:hypothetical protein
MLTDADMIVGRHYRLKETQGHEHQDHWFNYPKDLIVVLDYIVEEEDIRDYGIIDTEDGPMQTIVSLGVGQVYHFDIPSCGMAYVFSPKDLELVEDDVYNVSIKVSITPAW